MNESSPGPCSKCGERPGTCHVTTIVNGKTEVADLCPECFGETQPAAVRKQMEELMNGTCVYCGAKAATSLSSMGSLIGHKDDRFACHECFQEHHTYYLKRLQDLASGAGECGGDAMQQLRSLQDEVDAHMRRWISQKLN